MHAHEVKLVPYKSLLLSIYAQASLGSSTATHDHARTFHYPIHAQLDNLLYQALPGHQILSSGRASSGPTTGVGISQELGEKMMM